jgi:hypothetical protein
MVRAEQGSAAPHAFLMGTLKGFPNPPAMVRAEHEGASEASGVGAGGAVVKSPTGKLGGEDAGAARGPVAPD